MIRNNLRIIPAIFTTMALSFSGNALADHADSRFEGAAYDAWLTGKIETVFTLNRELNPFTIDTDVSHGDVILSGTVDSDIDKALAGELALGVEGVTKVQNEIVVREGEGFIEQSRDQLAVASNNFMRWADDATTTASVKAKLLANSETEGLEISVMTENDVVTLEGEVSSAAEKQLAEEIAINTGDVVEVINQLVVASTQ
ncbi:MAG: BON domain-containing protein [Gammaproteobacteria bacterium]|jgi:osmotically-inducible protein OsmY